MSSNPPSSSAQSSKPDLNQPPALRYDGSKRDGTQGVSPTPAISKSDPEPRKTGSADMDVSGATSVHHMTHADTSSLFESMSSTNDSPSHHGDERNDDPAAKKKHREQRLASIKAAIDAGTYETPDKLEAALGRMFLDFDFDDDLD